MVILFVLNYNMRTKLIFFCFPTKLLRVYYDERAKNALS